MLRLVPLPNEPDERPAQSSPGLLSPGTKVGHGRFTLKKILGQGGMGMVWLAHDNHLGELVALKFLPPQIRFDDAAVSLLRRETTRSRKLSHPNIIRIHDLHQHEGEDPFIAMEYVDGPTLHAFRFSLPKQTLTWAQLAPLTKQLCDALDYAHAERVIHHDLKPSNLMLDSNGRLKLADFGIAAVVSDSVARVSGAGAGTPAYMSPQQIDGKGPQPTDDIYSLGATLYELLTSTPPFYQGQIVHQVLHNDSPPPTERLTELGEQNEIPADVEAMIMACLAKDPDRRPQSARAVADWIGFQPTPHPKSLEATITPSEAFAPDERPVPSKKGALIGALVLLALLAIGGWFWKTNKAARRAENPIDGQAGSAPASEEGFENLFNGRDLTGWEGDTNFWTVQEGRMVGRASQTKPLNGFAFMLWRGGVLEDFELRLSFRKTGDGGAGGVDYRNIDDYGRPIGYRCQIGPGWLVDARRAYLVELALEGQKTLTKEINGTNQNIILGRTASTNDIHRATEPGDWKKLAITATGGHLVHQINGLTIVDALDERPAALRAGILALQLHDRGTNSFSIELKDIRLKRFPMNPGRVVYTDNFELLNADGKAPYWNWTGVTNFGQTKRVGSEGQNHFVELQSEADSNRVELARSFPLDPTWKELRFSIRVRTHDLSGNASNRFGANLGIAWKDSQRQPIGKTEYTPFIQKASAWTLNERTLGVPSSARYVTLSQVLYRARGTADFDDLKVSLVEGHTTTESPDPRTPPPGSQKAEAVGERVLFSENFEDSASVRNSKVWDWEDRAGENPGGRKSIISEGGNSYLRLESPDLKISPRLRGTLALPADWQELLFSLRIRARLQKFDTNYPYSGAKLALNFRDSSQTEVRATSTLQLKHDNPSWFELKKSVKRSEVPTARVVRFYPYLHASAGIGDFDDVIVSVVESNAAKHASASAEDASRATADQQIRGIIAELKKLNPGYAGTHKERIDHGQVVELWLEEGTITNLWPVASLTGLRIIHLNPAGIPNGRSHSPLADLSPLRHLRLTRLDCGNTDIEDLSPLKAMPLDVLTCCCSRIKDLSPLRGLRLTGLDCCANKRLRDLSALRGMPLTWLNCSGTAKDLSPLSGMPLTELRCDENVALEPRNEVILRGLKVLTTINGRPVGEFWKRAAATSTRK